jgi:hypothetical protein
MVTKTITWNPMSEADYGLVPGKDVFSRDGEKVGSVNEVWHPEAEFPTSFGQHYFLVDPGLLKAWFGGYDTVYLPERAIERVNQDRIVVNLTKEQIKHAGWTTEPTDWDQYRRS